MTRPPVDVRRAETRGVSEHAPGVTAHHSFSFGVHYDPANLGFGPVVCHDEHTLAPGAGYDDHPHAELEIVTWVLDGALRHRSDLAAGGGSGEVAAGAAQVLSAGSGVVHAETAAPGAGPTRFVQTWLRPDSPGGVPSYAGGRPVAADGLVPVAGAGSDLPVGVAGATLWVVAGSGSLVLPETPLMHVFVARGTVRLGAEVDLAGGDAVRLEEAGGAPVEVGADAELLVWSFADPSAPDPMAQR